MKFRNINVVIVVFWQGKDGEFGFDVSSMDNKYFFIIVDVDGFYY